MTNYKYSKVSGRPLCSECNTVQDDCECDDQEAGFAWVAKSKNICVNCGDTELTCDCGEFVLKTQPKGAWCICPECDGEGKHSRNLGSFTQSEFNESFDTEDSRDAYFRGDYDQTCNTCAGTGKIREDDTDSNDRYHRTLENERIRETGRNDAGEWVCYPDWHRGSRF